VKLAGDTKGATGRVLKQRPLYPKRDSSIYSQHGTTPEADDGASGFAA